VQFNRIQADAIVFYLKNQLRQLKMELILHHCQLHQHSIVTILQFPQQMEQIQTIYRTLQ